tara:strand:+ start:613 stop:1260 length:648 start_codon:yes stop_codon:yes gene_type:complete
MASIEEIKAVASRKQGFARSNQFLVTLPGEFGGWFSAGDTPRTINLLCSRANLPGKQIMTTERRIGLEMQKMAYGFGVSDLNMTFYLMNDYGIKDYFDAWRRRILSINDRRWQANYKNNYARPIEIHQLKRPIVGLKKSFGPIRITADLGGGTVYSVRCIDAFPTTITDVQLSNEMDGLVELSVTFAYTNWENNYRPQGWINLDIQTPLGAISLI